MSFEQIRSSSGGDQVTDEEAFLQTPRGEAGKRWPGKFGIIGGVILSGAAVIVVALAPWGRNGTRSIVPGSIVSFSGGIKKFTSPYYMKKGGCPEGEMIQKQDECFSAFALLWPNAEGKNGGPSNGNRNPGCMADYTSAEFNPKFEVEALSMRDFVCKRKDVPDYAELQADDGKLMKHCLLKTGDHSSFKACVQQIIAWTEDDNDFPEPFEPKDPQECSWTEHADKYSGGYANGVNTKFDVAAAKTKCLELSHCIAVTCNTKGQCTVRAGGLGDSTFGEVTHTPDC